MSWKPVLLTTGTKPPAVLATVKDDMLKLQISPEIANLVGLSMRKHFSAYVGTAGEHGQVKLVQSEGGGGRVRGGNASPVVLLPSEASWPSIDDNSKCDYEIVEDEKTLIINLPWFNGQTGETMQGNRKVTSKLGAKLCDYYRRGVSRRKLAEHYGLSEATVVHYTNDPEDVAIHNTAIQARRAAGEAKALIGTTPPATASETTPTTVYPAPRPVSGLYKPQKRFSAR